VAAAASLLPLPGREKKKEEEEHGRIIIMDYRLLYRTL
jgi:hypothetical protein